MPHIHGSMRLISTNRRSMLVAATLLSAAVLGASLASLGCLNVPSPVDAADADVPISFATQVQPILAARCVTCHRNGGVAAFFGYPLRLEPDLAFDSLTTLDSIRVSGAKLVVPGDPDASYFYEKVALDNPRRGSRMPIGAAALSDIELEILRRWIEEGAADN